MSIYNLEKFGYKLKEIRKNLNITQLKIVDTTGISERTIRNIENGKTLPSLDVLEILSEFYNTDLIALLIQYRLDDPSVFSEMKNKIEAKLYNNDGINLDSELKSFKTLLSSVKNPYYKKLIKQFILFTKACILCQKEQYEASIRKSIETIQITNENFKIENYNLFSYSTMEIRSLMSIGIVEKNLKNYDKAFEIMNFCIASVDTNNEIFPKFCFNISDLYIKNDEFEKVLKYSDLGIKSCQNTDNYHMLPWLYYQKGFVQFKLDDKKYMDNLDMSLNLCDAFDNMILKTSIIEECKEFLGIEL